LLIQDQETDTEQEMDTVWIDVPQCTRAQDLQSQHYPQLSWQNLQDLALKSRAQGREGCGQIASGYTEQG
jgi:hypothetical protein